MATIIVTGINGFVGKHLTRELVANGHEVIGIGMDQNHNDEIADQVSHYVVADLSKEWPDIADADSVIHLAGLAAVGPSFNKPQEYITLNSSMVTHMCEYYLKQEKKPRILIVSSGAIYDASQPLPLTETSPVSFTSPYSVSKVLLENQAAYYQSRGLDCVIVRPFNHIGPGQALGFLIPDLAEKLITRQNSSESITVGNITTKRDYTDVRDVVRAYRLIATSKSKPKQLIYNVCSGTSHSGEEALNLIVQSLEIKKPEINIDQSIIRPNDIVDIRGDNSRLRDEFNWKPSYDLNQTIDDFIQSLTS